jgi:hypothetical protein
MFGKAGAQTLPSQNTDGFCRVHLGIGGKAGVDMRV